MATRSTFTKLCQSKNPEPGQVLWFKTARRGLVYTKVKSITGKRKVNDGKDYQIVTTEFPGYQIIITKHPELSTRPKQETSGWTRCLTEGEEEDIDLKRI